MTSLKKRVLTRIKIKGKRAITANTAIKLSDYFGNSAQFWLNLQTSFDLALEYSKLKKSD